MLIKCPECELQVSDKALSCPHCGYPLKEKNIKRPYKSSRKHKRLPNGFGQISQLKGLNLRKPFRAMVTIGKTDEGKPICKLLQPAAYFETYNDAYQALMEYNKNPYVIENAITVEELYTKWHDTALSDASKSLLKATHSAWNYCDSVKNIKVINLRPRHIRTCIDSVTDSFQTQKRIKSLFNKILDYAVEYEVVDKNISRSFNVSQTNKPNNEDDTNHHIPYTDSEMKLLWENIKQFRGIDKILVQCYTGLRPKELELLETKNINLEERIMTGGVKTAAGKNRIIPIHSKILPIITDQYAFAITHNHKYLFSTEGTTEKVYTYYRFATDVNIIVKELNLNPDHKPHDGRSHFITQAKKYQMNEYAIKRIVGHTITDITESVYTTRGNDWLLEEIEKIK